MPRAEAREAPGDAKSYNELEWVVRSELTLWKGCESLANEGHSQYYEWPSLVFHNVNSLLIIHFK